MRTIEDMKTLIFPVMIEPDEDAFYAECPSLEGCISYGITYEKALVNIKEAIELYIEDMQANSEEIPNPKPAAADLPRVTVAI